MELDQNYNHNYDYNNHEIITITMIDILYHIKIPNFAIWKIQKMSIVENVLFYKITTM